MPTNNESTIKAYEEAAQAYIDAHLPHTEGSVKEWLDRALKLVPPGSHILEIGSAHGRDAQYMEDKGYKVDRTDAARSFVDYMASRGKKARYLNLLADDIGSNWQMIYANAVLLHFTEP